MKECLYACRLPSNPDTLAWAPATPVLFCAPAPKLTNLPLLSEQLPLPRVPPWSSSDFRVKSEHISSGVRTSLLGTPPSLPPAALSRRPPPDPTVLSHASSHDPALLHVPVFCLQIFPGNPCSAARHPPNAASSGATSTPRTWGLPLVFLHVVQTRSQEASPAQRAFA